MRSFGKTGSKINTVQKKFDAGEIGIEIVNQMKLYKKIKSINEIQSENGDEDLKDDFSSDGANSIGNEDVSIDSKPDYDSSTEEEDECDMFDENKDENGNVID